MGACIVSQSHVMLLTVVCARVVLAADVREPAADDVSDDAASSVHQASETGKETTLIDGRHFKEYA